MNKFVIFGALAFFVSCQAMDKSLRSEQIARIAEQRTYNARSTYLALKLSQEQKELAERSPHQRQYQLNEKMPLYKKMRFEECVAQERYERALFLLLKDHHGLSRICPLANDLLNVYNGSADGFFFEKDHPAITFSAVANAARFFAEDSGNIVFLANYKKTLDPCYEMPSSDETFPSSSGSSSWSDGEDGSRKDDHKKWSVNNDDDF